MIDHNIKINYHHSMAIQLRWMDADAFGHVNNTMYFQFYDTAKMEYFRTVCPGLVGKLAIVTVHIEADFMQQVYTKEGEVTVQSAITHIGNSSFTIRQRLVGKDGEEKCVGETIMVLYDTKKGEKVNFTQEWRAMIEDFEKRKL